MRERWQRQGTASAHILTVLGIRVEHIMRKTRSQVHSLTSCERVRRNLVTCPISEGSRLIVTRSIEE
jgi:hypothetical protein